jgi:hypothetical protein
LLDCGYLYYDTPYWKDCPPDQISQVWL